jgi:hypothetical protein
MSGFSGDVPIGHTPSASEGASGLKREGQPVTKDYVPPAGGLAEKLSCQWALMLT